MSTRLRQKEEEIQKILERLAQEVAAGTPAIVEGRKDIETLNALGVEGNLISAKTGRRTLIDVVTEIEQTGVKEIILLFDFDRRGREWTKRLKRLLESERIKPDVSYWCELFKLLGKDIKDIEGLSAYMETLKSKIHNS